jgi:hypothetical protein
MQAFGREYRTYLKTGKLPRMQVLPPELQKYLGEGPQMKTRKR